MSAWLADENKNSGTVIDFVSWVIDDSVSGRSVFNRVLLANRSNFSMFASQILPEIWLRVVGTYVNYT